MGQVLTLIAASLVEMWPDGVTTDCRARVLRQLYRLLLESPEWMEAQYLATSSSIAYRNDLALALRTHPDLLTLITLHAAQEAAAARSRNYDNEDLAIL